MNAHARAATAGEIVEIVGPLDDSVVMRIIDTGATAAEVLETFTWLSADDQIGNRFGARSSRDRNAGLRDPADGRIGTPRTGLMPQGQGRGAPRLVGRSLHRAAPAALADQ
jgi:hypothetical protein